MDRVVLLYLNKYNIKIKYLVVASRTTEPLTLPKIEPPTPKKITAVLKTIFSFFCTGINDKTCKLSTQ